MAAPVFASAQTSARSHRVGLLSASGPISEGAFGPALIRGLAQHSYEQGRNLTFEGRAAAARLELLPRMLEELVASKVEVILINGYPAAVLAKKATTLPLVVFAAGDPVATGLVNSLARPGGNLTGFSDVATELSAKRMELLKAITPGLRRVAMLWNADDLAMTLRYQASDQAAKTMGVSVQALGVREPNDFEQAFAAMNRERPDAILMVSDSLTSLHRKRVLEYATTHRIPAIYEFEFLVRDGGLMSYSVDVDEMFARIASLLDRILKGAKAGELPFEQPTRFRLVLNLKTAKAIGLDVPATLLARADGVIE